MWVLRLNMASPILGVGFELNAIAAVVIDTYRAKLLMRFQ
jgi:ribose/xylose/arabinose/galactoside ABC-type transport system permease subunit